MPNFPDILPDEPSIWYRRLCDYCAQEKRSFTALYNAERKKAGKGESTSLPGSWDRATKEWCWADRVAAYDRAAAIERAAELDASRMIAIENERHNLLADAARRRDLVQAMERRMYDSLEANQALLTPTQIASWARACAGLAQAARDDMAVALGIDGLLAQQRDAHDDRDT